MNSLRDLWDPNNSNNIHIIMAPEESKERTERKLEEIMTDKSPNLRKKNIYIHVQEVQQTSNRNISKGFILRHIISKLLEAKGRILQTTTEKIHPVEAFLSKA